MNSAVKKNHHETKMSQKSSACFWYDSGFWGDFGLRSKKSSTLFQGRPPQHRSPEAPIPLAFHFTSTSSCCSSYLNRTLSRITHMACGRVAKFIANCWRNYIQWHDSCKQLNVLQVRRFPGIIVVALFGKQWSQHWMDQFINEFRYKVHTHIHFLRRTFNKQWV